LFDGDDEDTIPNTTPDECQSFNLTFPDTSEPEDECVPGVDDGYAGEGPVDYWDTNGDGLLDNYNAYEFNGTVSARVWIDGNGHVGDTGDEVAIFVGDEQRGVSNASSVPPFLGGGYVFLTMVYSDDASGGEVLSFKYYDDSENEIWNITETLNWQVNLVAGDASCTDTDGDGVPNTTVDECLSFNLTFVQCDDAGDDCPSGNYDCAGECETGDCSFPESGFDCNGNCLSGVAATASLAVRVAATPDKQLPLQSNPSSGKEQSPVSPKLQALSSSQVAGKAEITDHPNS
jgi:hypothetical protein